MRVLYLGAHGPTNIRLTKEGIQIGDASPTPPPEFEYDTILIGNTKGFVSFAALKVLGKWGVTVGLMGRGGTPLSTFVPWARNDAPLRLAQMKAVLDPILRPKVARAFVEAKTGQKVPKERKTVTQIRAFEAQQASDYWMRLGVVRPSGFYKTLNAKATTPRNACINYAQGVHAVKVRTILAKIGLDPAIGFLHNSFSDKDAFVYDAQELARPIVDKVALDFARTRPESSFNRDEDWVYSLKSDAARELAYRVGSALSREVPYHAMRVPVDGVVTRELRRLGEWVRSPARSLDLHTFGE